MIPVLLVLNILGAKTHAPITPLIDGSCTLCICVMADQQRSLLLSGQHMQASHTALLSQKACWSRLTPFLHLRQNCEGKPQGYSPGNDSCSEKFHLTTVYILSWHAN